MLDMKDMEMRDLKETIEKLDMKDMQLLMIWIMTFMKMNITTCSRRVNQ